MKAEDNMSVVSKMTASTTATTVSTQSTVQSEAGSVNGHGAKDIPHRAVHRISMSGLSHNYCCVESAANRQRCSVIVVVKADGYGHGAINTALHLADSCGAEAFAVATLEEGIALRRAFETTPPFQYRKKTLPTGVASDVSELFTPLEMAATVTSKASGDGKPHSRPESPKGLRSMRPAEIRILVLGPPVGPPRCFDEYYHYNIEVMVSGPEIAESLKEWVLNPNERKRKQVARAAMESKAQALNLAAPKDTVAKPIPKAIPDPGDHVDNAENTTNNTDAATEHRAVTLTNVSGQKLAMEVRSILMNQQAIEAKKKQPLTPTGSGSATPGEPENDNAIPLEPTPGKRGSNTVKGEVFRGIEAAVKSSRNREVAAARVNALETGEENVDVSALADTIEPANATPVRRKLRWHALVDSGMGRLGFKTDVIQDNDDEGKRQKRDTVEILKELVDAEIHKAAPLEFYGMCTHMAEANSSSDYTNAQMSRFLNLLTRVRESGILVPTLSTDNSSALLTTSLTHFDPDVVLKQAEVDSRGWVRTGGAIYGQRSDFKQLRAISTLTASVRHVAVLEKGDSAGYDRAYVAPVDMRIATLTIGFADGYPRELGNGVGKVSIRGTVFPVAGNVCMDMLMVQLGPASDLDGRGAQVVVGDVAYLWGPENEDDEDGGLVKLKDLAGVLKTTQSALTCGLDKIRVRRELE